MLPHYTRFWQQFASPLRERRELAFSTGTTPPGGPGKPDDTDDMQNTPEGGRNPNNLQAGQPLPKDAVDYTKYDTHEQMVRAVNAQAITDEHHGNTQAADEITQKAIDLAKRHNAERAAETARIRGEEEKKEQEPEEEKEPEKKDPTEEEGDEDATEDGKKKESGAGESEQKNEGKDKAKLKDRVDVSTWRANLDKTQKELQKVRQTMKRLLPQAEALAKISDNSQEALARFKADLLELETLDLKLAVWGTALRYIERWKGGEVSPAEIKQEIEQASSLAIRDQDLRQELLGKLQTVMDEHAQTAGQDILREPLNDDARKVYVQALRADEIAQDISHLTTAVGGELRELQEISDVIAEEYKNSGLANQTNRFEWVVKRYSLNDLLVGSKNVLQAIKDSWKRNDKRRQAEASLMFGRLFNFLPGSDEVQHILRQTLQAEENKAKKDFMEYLEANRTTLEYILGPDGKSGLLQQVRHNPTLFMATVEYMANKGWLYKFDQDTGTLFDHYQLKPGTTLPAGWSDAEKANYFDDLQVKYSKGRDGQREDGKRRGKDILSNTDAIKAFNNQLGEMNYWGAIGVVEGMWEKAKNGQSSMLATVMFMHELRQDSKQAKNFRKYLPYQVLDKTSFAIQSLAYGPTLLKFEKDQISAYQENPEIGFHKAGVLAEAIVMLEEEITAAQARARRSDFSKKRPLQEVVAMALAGQVLKAEDYGWDTSISIFDPKYRDYRSEFEKQANMDPTKADATYYKRLDGGSEAILMKQDSLLKMLSTTNSGQFQYADIAEQMLEQILDRDDDFKMEDKISLRSGTAEAYRKFKQEVGDRMANAFIISFNNTNTAGLANRAFSKHKNQFILAEFFNRRLVDQRVLLKMLNQPASRPLGLKLLEQLGWSLDTVRDICEQYENPMAPDLRPRSERGKEKLEPDPTAKPLKKSEMTGAIKALAENGEPFSRQAVNEMARALVAKHEMTEDEYKTIFAKEVQEAEEAQRKADEEKEKQRLAKEEADRKAAEAAEAKRKADLESAQKALAKRYRDATTVDTSALLGTSPYDLPVNTSSFSGASPYDPPPTDPINPTGSGPTTPAGMP